ALVLGHRDAAGALLRDVRELVAEHVEARLRAHGKAAGREVDVRASREGGRADAGRLRGARVDADVGEVLAERLLEARADARRHRVAAADRARALLDREAGEAARTGLREGRHRDPRLRHPAEGRRGVARLAGAPVL